jgi:hypothetical protein
MFSKKSKLTESPSTEASKKAEAFCRSQEAAQDQLASKYRCILEGSRLRPCHFYPVTISHDGLRWTCFYLGCEAAVGYGDSPSAACAAFDTMWYGEHEHEHEDKDEDDDGLAGVAS